MLNGRYTVTLYELMKNEDCMKAIEKAMSTYPLYEKRSKEEFIPSIVPTREQLNHKILARYKYREIGFETIGRFLDELQIALEEIMPYYNQLLFTLDQDYNIMYNVDYTRETDTNRDDTGNLQNTSSSTSNNEAQSTGNDTSITNSTVSSDGKNVQTKTPQNELTTPSKNIDSISFADEVGWNKNGSESSENTTSTNQAISTGTNTFAGETASITANKMSESAKERVKGNYGQVSIQSLIERYRDLILNVEQRIIEDRRIKELFMLVY